MTTLTKLKKLAAKRGLRIEERGSGHIQILGGTCLVNYYPDSKRQSAYIADIPGSTRSGVTPEQAIEMAFEVEAKPKPVSRPVYTGLDDPKKRTPEQWIALLPSLKFAWRSR
jgi:hypothetical protein